MENSLLGYKMILNIIHDDRVFGRIEPLIEELEKNKIQYNIRAACIDKKTVLESITESFRRIIQDAKDKGLSEVWIAEDDLTLSCDRAWKYFVDNKPKDFDVYISGSYLVHHEWKYEPPLVLVNEWVGNHLIVVHEKYYDRWLESKPDVHIDNEQKGKGDFYVCFPYAALQRPSRSANCGYQEVNYNINIPKHYILQDE